MYFFLSNRYAEPSALIRDPAHIREDINEARASLLLSEKQSERLKAAKEALGELALLAPDSLATALLARIECAEAEYERLREEYEALCEELKEALFMLGRYPEGGTST